MRCPPSLERPGRRAALRRAPSALAPALAPALAVGLVLGLGAAGAPPARAACTCLDQDADGLPDVDGVCTGSEVEQVSPYPGEGPDQPPARISIRFDRELACGQYVNGDFWVVEPSPGAGVAIVATEPAFARSDDDGFGPRWKHGFQVDPVRVDAGLEAVPQGQSFDERVGGWVADGREGRAGALAPLPVRVRAGSTFLKAHGKPVWGGVPKSTSGSAGCQAAKAADGGPGGVSQNCIRAFMALTILASPPAAPSDTFRPPYVGRWDRAAGARDPGWVKPGTGGKKGYRYADVRFSAFPRLSHAAVSGLDLYIDDLAAVRDSFRLPQVDIAPHNHARRLKAYDSSAGGPLYGDGYEYAPQWAKVTNRAWLRLTGDDIRPDPGEEGFVPLHRQALVMLLQHGIDQLHLVIDGDKIYTADGGHYAGGYLPALMACHLFRRSAPVGYDVTPECEWLERNKAEGETVDVGFPMWGEQTYVYRTPQSLTQSLICSELAALTGHGCAALGIDPQAPKVLYGQKFAQRAYTDDQKDEGGQNSCLGSWAGNVSTHCRDPYQAIDHPGNACNPDPDQNTSNYERIVQPNLRSVATAARLYGIFRADGTGPFSNHIWDFVARRYWLGYETVPDPSPAGGSPSGYTGAGTDRCASLHHQHACAGTSECYPSLAEHPPVCWFCRGLLDQYPTYVHDPGPL